MTPSRLIWGVGSFLVAWFAIVAGDCKRGASLQALAASSAQAEPARAPARFGFGRPATPADVAAWDIDVGPDGRGLPSGRGTPGEGERTYVARCAACHGKTGKEGPNDVLVGREPRDGFPFGRDPRLRKTIGNYWPYATTLFDYIRRAMPPDAPGSLSDSDVYGLVAYLLYLNELVSVDAEMNATSLPRVAMPARDRFVVDRRGEPKAGR